MSIDKRNPYYVLRKRSNNHIFKSKNSKEIKVVHLNLEFLEETRGEIDVGRSKVQNNRVIVSQVL